MEIIKTYDRAGNVNDQTYLLGSDELHKIKLAGRWIFKEIGRHHGMPWIYYDATRAETITDIIDIIEGIMEFGETPRYACERRGSKIAVCTNNGQFHTDKEWSGQHGFATFVGYFTKTEAIERFC